MRFSNLKCSKKRIAEYITICAIVLAMIMVILAFQGKEYSYQRYETGSIRYVRAEVIRILDENLSESGQHGDYRTGKQTVEVKILEGDAAGQTVVLDHYVTLEHNVIVQQGSRIIVCADTPEGVEPYFTIYNYDRNNSVWLLVACFVILVVIVGKKQGIMSCIGLGFTLCMIVCYLLPGLYNGRNAAVVSAVTVIASTAVSCFCISGFHKKTLLNIFSTVAGVLSAGLVYSIFTLVLHISGATMNEAESLQIISQATGLQLSGVLFAGIMICSLGAVMDVAVSMGAALAEIRELNPGITPKELFKSGMNIGRDMIGTMTNTLILAFVGGSLATVIIFISYGVQFHQLMSSDFLALEVAQGLSGSAAVILTVPISAAICAAGFAKHKKHN